MRRRTFVGGAGLALAAIATAGCVNTVGYQGAGSSETPTESGGGAHVAGREFNLNVERRGQPDEQVTISVLAENVGDAPVEDVHFEVVVKDRDGEHLERHTASLDGLEPGAEWRHEFDLEATRDEISSWRGQFVYEE